MRLVCKQKNKQEVNLKCMLSSEKKVFHLIHKCTCIKNVFFFSFCSWPPGFSQHSQHQTLRTK